MDRAWLALHVDDTCGPVGLSQQQNVGLSHSDMVQSQDRVQLAYFLSSRFKIVRALFYGCCLLKHTCITRNNDLN